MNIYRRLFKINSKSIKNKDVKKKSKGDHNNEQNIVDNCWSSISKQKKMAGRIARINRTNSFHSGILSRCLNQPIRTVTRNDTKKSIVMMTEINIPKSTTHKKSASTINTGQFNFRNPMPSSVLNSNSNRLSHLTTTSGYYTARPSLNYQKSLPPEDNKLDQRDNLAREMKTNYDNLRNKLMKLTQVIKNEGYNIDSEITDSQRSAKNQFTIEKNNKERDSNKFQEIFISNKQNGPIISTPVNLVKESINKKTITSEVSKMKPKTLFKSVKENKPIRNKQKNNNAETEKANKCIARKHLGNLYSKIIPKVKEMERQKRTPVNEKFKTSEKCLTSRRRCSKPTII